MTVSLKKAWEHTRRAVLAAMTTVLPVTLCLAQDAAPAEPTLHERQTAAMVILLLVVIGGAGTFALAYWLKSTGRLNVPQDKDMGNPDDQ